MRILLTGATGYVGRNLIRVLLNSGNHQLFAITRKLSDLPVEVRIINMDAELEGNVINANPEMVIHLASFLTSRSEIEDITKLIDSNISFGTILLNALKKVSLKCFINVGSFSEYHHSDGILNPTYLYAATKTAFRSILTYYASINHFKVFHVIPYTIYGGIDTQKKIIDILFEAISAKEPIKISEGLQNLDFIHVNDVVDFFNLLVNNADKFANDDVLYLGTGRVNNLREVATLIEEITGKKVNANWGANPPRDRDTTYACAASGKIKEILKWEPSIKLKEGLNLKYKELQNGYSER
jgi:nucleoside-diphosphate-sugar epimerase